MSTLAGTSLTADERALLERFAEVARARLGGSLCAIWLFGSRARGERPVHEDSDIDLLVLVEDASWEGKRRLYRAFDEAAEELGAATIATGVVIYAITSRAKIPRQGSPTLGDSPGRSLV